MRVHRLHAAFTSLLILATTALFLAPASAAGAQRESLKPPGRISPGMAYDIDRNQVVVFGGIEEHGVDVKYLDDTWTWDGSMWTHQHPADSPPPGYGVAMTYDVANHNVVLFGGTNDHTTSNETWIWDGSNWTQPHPSSSPPIAFGSVMDYDSKLGKVVLLAGDVFNPGTTWSWDGTDWSPEPGAGPPARVFAAGAYDDSEGSLVVFGGSWECGDLPCPLDDTWTWDGTQWTQQSPGKSPSQRSATAAAYDQSNGLVVLFGGSDFRNYLDTWTWDGSTWHHPSPSKAPPARSGHAMVYDTSLGQVLLFGGGRVKNNLHDSFNDLWAWDGTTWTRIA